MTDYKLAADADLWRGLSGAERFDDGSEPLFLQLPDRFFRLGRFTDAVVSLAGPEPGERGYVQVGIDAMTPDDYRSGSWTVRLPFSKEVAKSWIETTLLANGYNRGLSRSELETGFGFECVLDETADE